METLNGAVEGTPNPLLNDLVLENLFSIIANTHKHHKPKETLLNCRQVCHKWNACAIDKIIGLTTINITFKPNNNSKPAEDEQNDEQQVNDNNVKKILGDPAFSRLPAYLSYLESNPALVFTNFAFRISMTNPLVADLFTRFGSQMQGLSLALYAGFRQEPNGTRTTDEMIDSSTFRELLRKTENLKTLCIFALPANVMSQGFRISEGWENLSTNVKKLTIYYNSGTSTSFYDDLFLSCPKLEHLTIYPTAMTPSLRNNYENGGLFQSLASSPCARSLKQLEVKKCIQLKSIIQLCDLKLKILRVDNLIIDADGYQFKHFFESQANTLQTLILNDLTRHEEGCSLRFPVMPKLQTLLVCLKTKPNITHFKSLNLDPINYPKCFPSLRRFQMGIEQNNLNFNPFVSALICEPHSDISELFLTEEINMMQLILLGNIFPNIKTLEISSGSGVILRQIWSTWSKLESLKITFNESERPENEVLSFDAIFTGFTAEQCTEIGLLKNPHKYNAKKGFPSIVKLKRLKRLHVRTKPCSAKLQMTNASIWGFSRLSSLEKLTIPNHKITKKGYKVLSKYRPFLKVKVHKLKFK